MLLNLFPEYWEDKNIKWNKKYQLIQDEHSLESLLLKLNSSSRISLDLETTGLNPFQDNIVGISISDGSDKGYYIPVGHRTGEDQLSLHAATEGLKTLFQNDMITIVLHNAKFDLQFIGQLGILEFKCELFDTMIASLVLNNEQSGLKWLTENILKTKQIQYEDISQNNKYQMDQLDVETVGFYACMDADYTLQLGNIFERRIKERNIEPLFKLEMGVLRTLLNMERDGVGIDTDYLEDLEPEYEGKILELSNKIYALIGPVNLNSNQQLANLLFGKMKFPVLKSTPDNGQSVDTWVLQELKKRTNHPVFDLLLEYRTEEKLFSTYIKGLQKNVDNYLRVHTSFWQIVSTGRMSSSNPNLQNIPPIVRRAIVADSGKILLSLDYSQIELRVLAFISGDRVLTESFLNDEDVHTRTASEIFGCKTSEVTKEMREKAKTMNFALVYGSTQYGIAAGLGVSVEKAVEFMNQYFIKYSGVKQYMEQMRLFVRANGFVETMLKRRVPIKDAFTMDTNKRERAERVAINAPIQGSAADVIKIAMTRVSSAINEGRASARLILQIHDELIFEAEKDKCTETAFILKKIMEEPPIEGFAIPLKVDVEVGRSYGELQSLEFLNHFLQSCTIHNCPHSSL
ncbi:MAG: hypothetical protein JNL74_21420 [Fibrobacteres bacterium]|nr:hypothetical protein [Fibrobacterota bacterium]